jgi:hypothetical protein
MRVDAEAPEREPTMFAADDDRARRAQPRDSQCVRLRMQPSTSSQRRSRRQRRVEVLHRDRPVDRQRTMPAQRSASAWSAWRARYRVH